MYPKIISRCLWLCFVVWLFDGVFVVVVIGVVLLLADDVGISQVPSSPLKKIKCFQKLNTESIVIRLSDSIMYYLLSWHDFFLPKISICRLTCSVSNKLYFITKTVSLWARIQGCQTIRVERSTVLDLDIICLGTARIKAHLTSLSV